MSAHHSHHARAGLSTSH